MIIKDWSEVNMGDRVRIKGVEWDVTVVTKATPKKKRQVTVKRLSDGFEHTGSPTGAVHVTDEAAPSIPNVDPAELAESVVKAVIGGEVVARIENGDHRIPRVFANPGSLAAHLYAYHGVRSWPQDETVVAMHDRLHKELIANGGHKGYSDHMHDLESS